MRLIEKLNVVLEGLGESEALVLRGSDYKKTMVRVVGDSEEEIVKLKWFVEYLMNNSKDRSPGLNDIISKINIHVDNDKALQYIELTIRVGYLERRLREVREWRELKEKGDDSEELIKVLNDIMGEYNE